MLSSPIFHQHPFPFVAFDATFSEEQCQSFEQLFLLKDNWQHRDGSFYQCAILDVTSQIEANIHAELIKRLRTLTALPLIDHTLVTAQYMSPGQAIGLHSDRPLLGYEILRLVVQLNPDWQVIDGGVLELYANANGEAVQSIEPRYNKGFVFTLNEKSYHGVTQAQKARRSLVFNFWHVANTPNLEQYLKDFFRELHFSELPKAIDEIAAAADLELSEETTFIAETAAVALKRWGYNEDIILQGYSYGIGIRDMDNTNEETYVAVKLANWVAKLYRESFDLNEWSGLYNELQDFTVPKRLQTAWRYCFGVVNP